MEKSDFLNKFSKLIENREILEKLLLLHNCGIIQIDAKKEIITIFFHKKHHYFGDTFLVFKLNEFTDLIDFEGKEKIYYAIKEFKEKKVLYKNQIDIKIFNESNESLTFSIYLHNIDDNNVINGVFVENLVSNPFSTDLNEYSNFLELVLSSSKIFIWRWDYTNKKQIFNKEYYEFLGYDANSFELDFDTQRSLLHPDDLILAENTLNDYFSGKKDFYQIEFRIKKKNGDWQWILSKGKIVKVAQNNNPIELIGVHIDINEIKRLQNENEQTNTSIINLIDIVEDVICVKDGEGKWLLANQANLKLFGLEGVDYRGKTDLDLSYYTSRIYKDAFKTCMVTDEIAWKKGEISRSDERIPINDLGNERIFDVIKKPVFNQDGSRRVLIVMGRDVTEKRSIEQIERRLATQNRIIREFAVLLLSQKTVDNVLELLTKYLSEINNNIIVITTKLSNNNILKISSVYPSTFVRMITKHFPNVVDRIVIKLSDEYINNTLEKFKHFGVVHSNLYDASLQKLPKYIAKTIQELFGIKLVETIGIIFENQCYGFISFFIQDNDLLDDKDIIESMVYLAAQTINRLNTYDLLENAKKAYEISNLSKDKFFSVLAHDLEKPIQNLLRFSETLSSNFNTIPVSDLKKLLSELRENISYTNYILENLFEWSKIEMNKIEFMPKATSIYKFYIENERLILAGTSQKSLTFVNLLNQEHFVEVDVSLISMVFRNLINNAIKFTPKKGKIEIESYDIGNFIRVDIRDNGVGIDKENLHKLFRKDIKFSTLGTEGEEGTGLGLIVAQSYIRMHGGELHIDSEKDKGTIVFFTLPKHI